MPTLCLRDNGMPSSSVALQREVYVGYSRLPQKSSPLTMRHGSRATRHRATLLGILVALPEHNCSARKKLSRIVEEFHFAETYQSFGGCLWPFPRRSNHGNSHRHSIPAKSLPYLVKPSSDTTPSTAAPTTDPVPQRGRSRIAGPTGCPQGHSQLSLEQTQRRPILH